MTEKERGDIIRYADDLIAAICAAQQNPASRQFSYWHNARPHGTVEQSFRLYKAAISKRDAGAIHPKISGAATFRHLFDLMNPEGTNAINVPRVIDEIMRMIEASKTTTRKGVASEMKRSTGEAVRTGTKPFVAGKVLARLATTARQLPSRSTQAEAQASLTTAIYWLNFIVPKTLRGVLVGDVEERFYPMVDRFGLKQAKRWLWYQVMASFWPFVAPSLGRMMRTGTIGTVVAFAVKEILSLLGVSLW